MTDPEPDPNAEQAEGEASSTRYTCPECGGHLTRDRNGDVLRFICMVGHAYAPASLDEEQATAVEGALWTAVRLLGDRSVLLQEMADRASQRGHERSAETFRHQAGVAHQAGRTIHALLLEGKVPTTAVMGAAD